MKVILYSLFVVSIYGCVPSDKDTSDLDTTDTTDTTDTQNNTNTTHEYENISTDTTWNGNHTINGSITVTATLTIEACSTIHMSPNSYISVQDGGRILSTGTEDCLITFTSTENDPASGDWGYIELYTNGNVFDWTVIEYAGNDYASIWVADQGTVTVTNSTFANSERGIELMQGATLTSFSGNTFTGMEKFIMSVATEHVKSLNPITATDNNSNFIVIKNGTLERDGTWKNPAVPFKTNGFTLDAEVTVEAGTVFMMEENAYILVNNGGALINNGTQADPVIYTSASIEPQSGDWGYIDLYSNGNVFDWTIVEYAGKDYASVFCNDNSSITITNSVFSDSKKALEMRDGSTLHNFSDNTFTRIEDYIMTIAPDHVNDLGTMTGTNNETPSIEITYGTLRHDAMWKHWEFPYSVNSVTITAEVTVEAGSTLLMVPDALISINDGGSVILDGRQNARITVTSEKGNPLAGDWAEFDIYSTSNNNNRFSYADIMYGGGYGYGAVWLDDGAYLELDHVTFSHNEQCDMRLYTGSEVVASNTSYLVCE